MAGWVINDPGNPLHGTPCTIELPRARGPGRGAFASLTAVLPDGSRHILSRWKVKKVRTP